MGSAAVAISFSLTLGAVGGSPPSLAHVSLMIPSDKRHYLSKLDDDSQMLKG